MKDGFVKVAVATPNIKVANCHENAEKIIEIAKAAESEGVKLIVFPELCLTAYTCADLFLSDKLIASAEEELIRLSKETKALDMLISVGIPISLCGKLYNCVALLNRGSILGVVPKSSISNYGEFYEARHFAPAPKENTTINIAGKEIPFGKNLIFACHEVKNLRVAAEICQDLWTAVPPSCEHAAAGATVILNSSASNEAIGKEKFRRDLVSMQSAKTLSAYLFANAGNGESTTDLVFSGHSIIAENGRILSEVKPFKVSQNGFVSTEIDVNKIAHERQRVTTCTYEPSTKHQVIYFNLELCETVLTRFVNPHPFVPMCKSELSDRCERIFAIQANGLTKRIEAAYAKKCVVAVSGGLDSCLALLITAKAMDILKRPHSDIIAVTLPCFGTTNRTKSNAEILCTELGTDFRCIDIAESVKLHFRDIKHDENNLNIVYENAQARERTQIIMDIANAENGLVIGTGDLSELALGWATYNGDHMSMYGVNSSIPKTLLRHLVEFEANKQETLGNNKLASSLRDILLTPVSPELLPANDDEIFQKTEDLVGPYELHDFYLYNMLRLGFSPRKIYRLSEYALGNTYDKETRLKWLRVFTKRFFAQQFKRSCLPDGPKVGSVSVSPRGDLHMPSDACSEEWLKEIESLDNSRKG